MRHLHNLRRQNKLYATASAAYSERFRQGFTHCASEVSQFLSVRQDCSSAHALLMRHLRDCMQRCELVPQLAVPIPLVRMSSPPLASSDLNTHISAKDFSFSTSSAFLKSDVSVNNNYLSNFNHNNHEPVVKCDTMNNNNNTSSSEMMNNSWPESLNQTISPKNNSKTDSDVWRPW